MIQPEAGKTPLRRLAPGATVLGRRVVKMPRENGWWIATGWVFAATDIR